MTNHDVEKKFGAKWVSELVAHMAKAPGIDGFISPLDISPFELDSILSRNLGVPPGASKDCVVYACPALMVEQPTSRRGRSR